MDAKLNLLSPALPNLEQSPQKPSPSLYLKLTVSNASESRLARCLGTVVLSVAHLPLHGKVVVYPECTRVYKHCISGRRAEMCVRTHARVCMRASFHFRTFTRGSLFVPHISFSPGCSLRNLYRSSPHSPTRARVMKNIENKNTHG